MIIKNFEINLSKDDILKLVKLQDKVIIQDLLLENDIKVGGLYKFIGINIDFETTITLCDIKNNVIYLNIKDFKLSKKDSSNPLVKRSISFITKSINDIEGMKLNSNLLSIDIERIVKVYLTDTFGIKLNNLDIDNLTIRNNILKLLINNINLTIEKNN